jgi:hypothetical protein
MTAKTAEKLHKTRWQEINEIWQKDKWLYGIIGLLAGFMVGIAASDYLGQFVTWFWDGFWNEALSIAITVVLLDRLNKLRAEQERKAELIFQLGSDEIVITKQAARILKHKRWIEDGSLRKANLVNANLAGVQFRFADLEGANFIFANLKDADLVFANLEDAVMISAYLQGARLTLTNLKNAVLEGIYLKGANLGGANLQGATLKGANLNDITWQFESGSEVYTATLPDGTKWTEGRDMREFTHPEEWRKEQGNSD